MPIIAGEIQFFRTSNAGLGGAISSDEIPNAELHNFFGPISSADAAAGAIEYRCMYVKNTNSVLTLEDAKAFIEQNTPLSETVIGLGLGTSGVNGTEQIIADKYTAPAGVTFTELEGETNGLVIGAMPADQHHALWLRRTVNAGTPANSSDNCIIQVKGETVA